MSNLSAAIYIRKSREEAGRESHRLTVQREQLPAHARAQGWQVEIYDDGHASAARGKAEDLKERSRLERDIRAGRVQVVLCIELSRLSRDDSLQDYVAWLHLCAEHRVKLATPSRILDPSQHSDWMLLLMEGGFSSVEMRVLKARMEEGWKQAFREGKYLSGNPPAPYVYDKTLGGLRVDKEQLERMRRLWTLAETCSAREVARQMDMPFMTVRRAIADDRLLMYQGLRLDPETGETIRGQWPAVIDADQAERIRAGRRKGYSGYHRREYAGLLSNMGILLCGYCGRACRAWQNNRTRSDGSRRDYYGCSVKDTSRKCAQARMIPQAALDDRVSTNLCNTLGQVETLRQAWQADQKRGGEDGSLETLDAEERRQQTRKSNLVAAIADGLITMEDAKGQMAEIKSALEEIQRRRKEIRLLQQPEPAWDDLTITREIWDALEPKERRQLLRATVEEIRLFTSYAVITYRFPRNESGDRTARIHLPPKEKGGRRPGSTNRK